MTAFLLLKASIIYITKFSTSLPASMVSTILQVVALNLLSDLLHQFFVRHGAAIFRIIEAFIQRLNNFLFILLPLFASIFR